MPVDRKVVNTLGVIVPFENVGFLMPDPNLRDFISFNAGMKVATFLPVGALRRPMVV